MIYLRVNDNNMVYGYSFIPHVDFPVEFNIESTNIDIEEFKINFKHYQYLNNTLTCIKDLQTYNKEIELRDLKDKRETLFKKYIDRSKMWYDSLTQEQYEELTNWYQTWCDMTVSFENETWIEPIIPTWI